MSPTNIFHLYDMNIRGKVQNLRSIAFRHVSTGECDTDASQPVWDRNCLLDSFITVHAVIKIGKTTTEKLLYVSEVCEGDSDPYFPRIVLPSLPNHSSNKTMAVRLWVRREEERLKTEYGFTRTNTIETMVESDEKKRKDAISQEITKEKNSDSMKSDSSSRNSEQKVESGREEINKADTKEVNKTDTEELNKSDTEELNNADTEDFNIADTEDLNKADMEDLNIADTDLNKADMGDLNKSNTKEVNDSNLKDEENIKENSEPIEKDQTDQLNQLEHDIADTKDIPETHINGIQNLNQNNEVETNGADEEEANGATKVESNGADRVNGTNQVKSNVSGTFNSWTLIASYTMRLDKLAVLDGSFETVSEYYTFKQNTIIMNLEGMLCAIPGTFTPKDNKLLVSSVTNHRGYELYSYSFDSIRSLTRLSKSIAELLAVKHRLSGQISTLARKSPLNIDYEIERCKREKKDLSDAIHSEAAARHALEVDIESLKIKLKSYKQGITRKQKEIIEAASTQSELVASQIDPLCETLDNTVLPGIVEEVRRQVLRVASVFPIQSIPNSVNFSIANIKIASSTKELLDTCYQLQETVPEINAALSYIVQLVNVLATICNTVLEYPMIASGSESVILDALGKEVQTLPLSYDPKLTVTVEPGNKPVNKSFERALGLLNCNITHLIHSAQQLLNNNVIEVPLDCMDNLLWNLQYLVLFMTAE